MAHITHTDPKERTPNRPGKYACSGIDALIQNMERAGALRSRLVAALAGGAEVTVKNDEDDTEPLIIDAGVCRAVQLELERHGIPISGKDLGGKSDRSVILDVAHGFVRVKSQQQEKTICELRAIRNQALAA